MEDKLIVSLYWERSESAIIETQIKYDRYLKSIAKGILFSDEDAEECVNDTYLKTWNSIPDARPESLKAFVGKITRNTALDRYDQQNAYKRIGTCVEIALHELEECIPADCGSISDDYVLRTAINGFLASLPKRTRIVFMQRYWYLCKISEIAQNVKMSESNVKVLLLRTREKFKAYLEREGISL